MSIPDWQVAGTMDHAQRNALLNALQKSRYRITNAAMMLRISRSTTYRLMRRFDIDVPEGQDETEATSIAPAMPSASVLRNTVIFDGANYLLVRR